MWAKVASVIPVFVFSVSATISAKATELSEARNVSMAKLHVPFIENRGQVHEDVAFYAKTFGGTIFVTKDGRLVYSLSEGRHKRLEANGELEAAKEVGMAPLKAVALRESFVGRSPDWVRGEEPSEAKVSYFRGNDPSKWVRGLSTYQIVSLGEIYEGIEVRVKAHGSNIEKLFFIKPGASPDAIKVKVEGGEITVDEKGELRVETGLGVIKFTKPVAYQDVDGKRVQVPVSYKKVTQEGEKGAIYGFDVGEYDPTKPLLVDPLLASTFLGGSSGEEGYSIALDSSGNVYVTGWTQSSDYPTTAGAHDTNYGADDVFVSKLNGELTQLLSSTFLGGSGDEWGYSIALDTSGDVFVTGYTNSPDYPTTAAAYDTSHSRSGDVFVSKLNKDLTQLLASTFIGGSGYDRAFCIALDSFGNVYLTGHTSSSDYPIAPGAYDTSYNGGGSDLFVSKLNNDLTQLLASTFIGGSGDDWGRFIALDSSGNVFVSGWTDSSDYPTTSGGYDTSHNGYWDVFVSKLNGNLTQLIASTFLGGTELDWGRSIALDITGNVYVTGETYSSDYPTTASAYDSTYNNHNDSDVFVSKLNNDLTQLLASTFLGGSGYDWGYSIALDGLGNVYVTGHTHSSDYPTTPAAYDTTRNGGHDVFVSKFNNQLTQLLASTLFGGSHDDWGYSIAVDSTPRVYVTGYTWSSDYPTTSSAYDTIFNGARDVFVSKLDANLSAMSTTYDLSITTSGNGHGTVTSDPEGIICGTECFESYPANTTVTLIAIAASGSTFYGWGGDCSSCGSNFTCQIIMNADMACIAIFNPVSVTTYTLAITKAGTGSGTITSSPAGVSCGSDCSEAYPGGTAVVLTERPDSGSTFGGWGGDCSSCGTASTCEITMDAEKTCIAIFSSASGPDFTGNWERLTQKCKNTITGLKCKLSGGLRVENRGNQTASSGAILHFYLSSDESWDSEDTLLKQVEVGALKAGRSKIRKLNYALPLGESAQGKYVIAWIDAEGAVQESNEANNIIVSQQIQ